MNDSCDAIEIVLGSMYAYFICLNQKYNDIYKDLVSGKSEVLLSYSSPSLSSTGMNIRPQNKTLKILNEIDKNCNGVKELGVVDFEIKTGLMTTGYRFIMNNLFEGNRFNIKDHIEFIGDFELQ